MKNTTAYFQNEQAKKNGGCGREMVFSPRTATGELRVCGITGTCDLCRSAAAAASR